MTLYATLAANWRDLNARWSVAGVDPWTWTASTMLDVVAAAVTAAHADDDPITATRRAAELDPDGYDGWGRITHEEAAAIVAADGQRG